MSNTPPDNAVEQRRKVLKGALAASGVVTMGYSGSALASFSCIERTTAGAPINGDQLVQTKPTQPPFSDWKWVSVTVYVDSNGKSGGFQFANDNYTVPLDKVVLNGNATYKATGNPVCTSAIPNLKDTPVVFYLLALYNSDGTPYHPIDGAPYKAGGATSPATNELPAAMPQPAAESCLTSLTAAVTVRSVGG